MQHTAETLLEAPGPGYSMYGLLLLKALFSGTGNISSFSDTEKKTET